MKKKDIIQLVKETIAERRKRYGQHDYYGNNVGGRNSISGMPGVWEKKSTSNKLKDQPFPVVGESQGTLASDMLNYADQYHMELVDTMKGVSTYPDRRTEGFYIKFPHYNGPDYTGAMFGKDVSDKIEKSKAAAKAAALKTYTKFQDQIEDYEISDHSRAGVYGSVHLWIMPKDMNEMHDFEKKYGDKIKPDTFKNNPKLQPGKTVIYGGTRYEVLENSGYVLTLQSLESGKTKKVNLNQFISQGAIKENNMKKNIKEADLYTLTSTDGEEKQVSFPDQNTAMAAASKNANVKQVVKLEGEDESSTLISSLEDILKTWETKRYASGEEAAKEYFKDIATLVQNAKVKENTPDDDEDEERGWMGADDAKDMMENYIKERGDDNLKEHMDKYRKRAQLMEGATEKLFALFNQGKTDAEVRAHYLQMQVDMPESFISKLRNNWESLRKTKLDLTLADKEAEGFQTIQPEPTAVDGMEGGEIDGMEENKELASGLFTK